ncbi:hypothetical protein [uncultured Paludibaculum sp.]|uniref:hypothetical protein n=1 Tax=uncultured Paludibaculum sp. TaxID=1765020 RepID=UPI002AAAE3AC|nr:hypothetical protein [uncultured Paludibaculum sp.]
MTRDETKTMTREEWLNAFAHNLRDLFQEAGLALPDKLRISVGWPSVRPLGRKKRAIGECWDPKCSTDQTTEIFISPFLQDAGQVGHVLVHELVHAAVGNEAGHKGEFIVGAKKLGLMKPWTATTASPELEERLVPRFPTATFPHATLDATMVEKMRKKQSTRMVKVECDECGYTARTTKKWLEDKGAPICPCNGKPMSAPDADAGAGDAEDGEDEMSEAA